MPPSLHFIFHIISRFAPVGKRNFRGCDIIGKMGRPTENPRTEKVGFRMSKKEAADIQKCADAMNTHRVNAVVEGIRLLKEKLGIE